MKRLTIPTLTDSQKILVAMAVIPALTVYWFGQITFFIDSHTYALNGYYLFDPMNGCNYYWRTFGYPLALALTGVRWLGSFEGILLLQALAAMVMPWMLYRMLRLLSESFAFWATLLLSVSLLPNLFQDTIYPDQLQVCLGFIVSYYAVRAVLHPSLAAFRRVMIWIGIIMFFRPTLLAFYGVLPLLCWYSARHAKRQDGAVRPYLQMLAIGTLCIATAQMGHAMLNAQVFQRCAEENKGAIPDQYSMLGKQLFVNAYLYSYGIDDIFSAQTGAATGELAEGIYDFMHSDGMLARIREQQHLPKLRELQESGQKKGLADYVLTHPHHDYFWLIYFTPVADSIFRDASLEMYWSHPTIIARVLWFSWNGFTYGEQGLLQDGADLRYLYLVPNFSPAWIILDPNYKILPPALADELRGHLQYRYISQETSDLINVWWTALFAWIAQLVMWLAAIGVFLLPLLYAMPKARREFAVSAPMLAVCEGLLWLHVLPLMLMTIPMVRYQSEAVITAVPAAAVTAWVLWCLFSPLPKPCVDKTFPPP
uniref:Glycosyltransferase RgtA/B/C/D-like domain-containing protein n=1 Tax=uncultured bacterium CSL1 TaxID=1091565 RepID=G4WVB4_9BACT|nr:hypothetical protein [uncultured bacterium CSL1]